MRGTISTAGRATGPSPVSMTPTATSVPVICCSTSAVVAVGVRVHHRAGQLGSVVDDGDALGRAALRRLHHDGDGVLVRRPRRAHRRRRAHGTSSRERVIDSGRRGCRRARRAPSRWACPRPGARRRRVRRRRGCPSASSRARSAPSSPLAPCSAGQIDVGSRGRRGWPSREASGSRRSTAMPGASEAVGHAPARPQRDVALVGDAAGEHDDVESGLGALRWVGQWSSRGRRSSEVLIRVFGGGVDTLGARRQRRAEPVPGEGRRAGRARR